MIPTQEQKRFNRTLGPKRPAETEYKKDDAFLRGRHRLDQMAEDLWLRRELKEPWWE